MLVYKTVIITIYDHKVFLRLENSLDEKENAVTVNTFNNRNYLELCFLKK